MTTSRPCAESAIAFLPPDPLLDNFLKELESTRERDPRAVLSTSAARSAAAEPSVYVRLCQARVRNDFSAAILAVWLGGMVEGGQAAAPLAESLLERFPALAAAARRHHEHQDPAGEPAWAGLQFMTMAAMTAWARYRPARMAARQLASFRMDLAYLSQAGAYCHYVESLLNSEDFDELLVLAPPLERGWVVRVEAVQTAAHLFCLLEAELLPGPRPPAAVVSIARGEAAYENLPFSIEWMYYPWYAWPGLALASMIGVEMELGELPHFEGRPTLLVGPKVFGSRSAGSDFFPPLHDALRSGISLVRELDSGECAALLGRMVG